MSTYLYGEPADIITADGIFPIPKCIPEEIAAVTNSADVFFIYQNRGIDRLKKEIEFRNKELVEKRHELKFVMAVRILIVYLQLELKKLEEEEKETIKAAITPPDDEDYEITVDDYKKDPEPEIPSALDAYKVPEEDDAKEVKEPSETSKMECIEDRTEPQ